MLSYYVIYYETFIKVMQQTEKDALSTEVIKTLIPTNLMMISMYHGLI